MSVSELLDAIAKLDHDSYREFFNGFIHRFDALGEKPPFEYEEEEEGT